MALENYMAGTRIIKEGPDCEVNEETCSFRRLKKGIYVEDGNLLVPVSETSILFRERTPSFLNKRMLYPVYVSQSQEHFYVDRELHGKHDFRRLVPHKPINL